MDEVNGVCLQYLQGMITAEEGMNKILALQAEAALGVIVDAEARDVSMSTYGANDQGYAS